MKKIGKVYKVVGARKDSMKSGVQTFTCAGYRGLSSDEVEIVNIIGNPFTGVYGYTGQVHLVNSDGKLSRQQYTFLADDIGEEVVEKIVEEIVMRKFKVGDFVTGNPKSNDEYGVTNESMKLGVVTDVSGTGSSTIQVEVIKHVTEDFEGCSYWVESKFFDIITFRIGQKVKVTAQGSLISSFKKYEIVTVSAIDNDRFPFGCKDKDGHLQWFTAEGIVAIDDVEETKIEEEKKMEIVVGKNYRVVNRDGHCFGIGTVVTVLENLGCGTAPYKAREVGGDFYQWLSASDLGEIDSAFDEVDSVFEVGDIITGRPESDDEYGWTTTEMTKGKVVDTAYGAYDDIKVEILEHSSADYEVGSQYWVKSDFFKLVEDVEAPKSKKFKKGMTVEPNGTTSEGYTITSVKGGMKSGEVLDTRIDYDGDEMILIKLDTHPAKFWVEASKFVEKKEKEKEKQTKVFKFGDVKVVFNGDYTIVTDGKRTGKAKRHADDEYNAMIGLEYAYDRFESAGEEVAQGDKIVITDNVGSIYGAHHYDIGQKCTVISVIDAGDGYRVRPVGKEYGSQTLVRKEFKKIK